MLDIKTGWDDLTLHEVMHPLGVTNAVVYLVRDAAHDGFGGWSMVDEKEKDGYRCSALFNGQSCYIAVVATSENVEATSDLFICQCHYDGYHPDKDKEREIAKRALVQILDELIESQRLNRLVD
jgi:hypothetical protein